MAIDRSEVEKPLTAARPDAAEAEMMRAELQSVIASPDFARAPIMKRLLCFLVGETAAARGDQLKAYSVAVDGLGRAPDYDARADSYPRVQVGRLRRMLDSYYSVNAPVGGRRLTIPSGRYRVALQPVDVDAGTNWQTAERPVLPDRPLAFAWEVTLLLVLVALVAATLLQLVPTRTSVPAVGRDRPTVELAGAEMARQSELGNLVRAALLNGLGRSDIYDLRALRRSGTRDPQARPAQYRLSTDLVDGENPRLFLRLTRLSPDRLLWSGDIGLPAGGQIDGAELDRRLAPVIATIGRASGLIATHELQENGALDASGYSCLLLYHRYRKDRTDTERDYVHSCVEQGLRHRPGNAGLQAAAAQLAIERIGTAEIEPRERAAQLQIARRHAQIATAIDPRNPWTNAARARVAVIRKACVQAVSFAMRAAELQPYDPALLADVGLYLLDCGDPRAEAMIRRAITLDDNPEGRFYAPLLLLAIDRGDHRLAREALAQMAPPVIGRHGRFYLVSAAGYAMLGDHAHARSAWAQLKAANAEIALNPGDYFIRLGYAPELRAKVMSHLRRSGLPTS